VKVDMNTVRAVITIVLLAAFSAFVVYMLGQLDLAENEWQRLVWVFSGFEAIVFAAVGWFFGREVNRERAEKAEAEADAAQKDAKENALEAERGRAVANAVIAHGSTAPQRGQRLQAMGASDQTAGAVESELEVLQEFCRRQFPDLA
jgi:Na+-transporting methylmalonyl-CoA/oxaloacetate decarboxylase gamma subunit